MSRDESEKGNYYFDLLPESRQRSPDQILVNVSEQLVIPLIDDERAASFRSVRQLSVGNRF